MSENNVTGVMSLLGVLYEFENVLSERQDSSSIFRRVKKYIQLLKSEPDLHLMIEERIGGEEWERDGVALIAAERRRQKNEEGYSVDHDMHHNTTEDMCRVAACYALPDSKLREQFSSYDPGTEQDVLVFRDLWPWGDENDKRPKHSYRKKLIIAGALIAAALDREIGIEKME